MSGFAGQDQSERFKLLLDINNAISSVLDLQELFALITKKLRPIFHQDGGAIGLISTEEKTIEGYVLDAPAGVNFEMRTKWPIEGTPAADVVATRKAVVVTTPDTEKYSSPVAQRMFAQGIRSGCMAPLIRGDQLLGVLSLFSKQPNNFSADNARLLEEIGSQIAIAFENALNFEKARMAQQQLARERDRLQLLLEINNAIVSHLDLKDVIASTSASLRRVVPHDGAFLILYNHGDRHQIKARAFNLNIADAITLEEGDFIALQGTPEGRALETRKTVLVKTGDLYSQYASPLVKKSIENGIRSGCAVPVISHGRILGVMSIVSAREDAFSEEDAHLLEQCSQQIAIAVENALSYAEIQALKNKLATEKLYLEDEIRTEHNFEELIGSSSKFQQVLKQVKTVAPTDSCVLIRGETGTGKELIARAIHALSNRSERALVKLNCSAIPTGLLESELFGHEKGAFTGAITQRIGRFELANKGTLFLDEIGDIPPELQPKLLRVLQEQEFERLGSTKTQKVDVRLIAATNSNLEEMVAEKKYRSDLYYRISGFPLMVPALRERREDIPELARFFTQKFARRLKKHIDTIRDEDMDVLVSYNWPGNVRELEHFIERSVIFTQGQVLEISKSELKQKTQEPTSGTLEESERKQILRVLQQTNWVIGGPNGAALKLGLKRTTLISRMQKLGIAREK